MSPNPPALPWRVLTGDALEVLRTLPDRSVHCVCTSPPYYALRDYRQPGQIGLEGSVGEYVSRLVGVFAEVNRVLRDDGTLWLNLGDSYTSGGRKGHGRRQGAKQRSNRGMNGTNDPIRLDAGLPDGNLLGVPWKVALALQESGWVLRQDIVWEKAGPMPEPVRTRCTRAHEFVFMFAKNMRYFYDDVPLREPAVMRPQRRMIRPPYIGPGVGPHRQGTKYLRSDARQDSPDGRRNARSVWKIASEPYQGAHFATWPSRLVERMILAGTSAHGCCACCQAPWRRVTERTRVRRDRPNDFVKRTGQPGTGNCCPNSAAGVDVATLGWSPSCRCEVEAVVPAVVLDPFSGSGTTLMVSVRLGRHALGIDLDPEAVAMTAERIAHDQLGRPRRRQRRPVRKDQPSLYD